MKNVFDLLESFSDANRRVLNDKKNSSRLFSDFTEMLEQVIALFDRLYVKVDEDIREEL